MRDLRSIFNQIIAAAVFMQFFSSCEDIPRDNILDPKNPSSRKDQIVIIEAFVNTNENLPPYNFWMLEALRELEDKYGPSLVICEYHRTLENYDDPYATLENDLLQADFTAVKGVPDVYINGSTVRIQGSSGKENSLLRLETALQNLLNQNSYFALEAEISRNGNWMQVRVQLARLGVTTAHNIRVKAVIKEKIDNGYHRHVVRKMLQSAPIERISPGDIHTVVFDSFEISQNGTFLLVLLVTSTEKIEHYQVQEVRLP
jgi:hypothetical protein